MVPYSREVKATTTKVVLEQNLYTRSETDLPDLPNKSSETAQDEVVRELAHDLPRFGPARRLAATPPVKGDGWGRGKYGDSF
ncbi:unnamed protein product, partial [Cylicostephanus goldi]